LAPLAVAYFPVNHSKRILTYVAHMAP
jgi:hypothetical protein